jgi:hypothetical protein
MMDSQDHDRHQQKHAQASLVTGTGGSRPTIITVTVTVRVSLSRVTDTGSPSGCRGQATIRGPATMIRTSRVHSRYDPIPTR